VAWDSPLDRIVSLRFYHVSVRGALDSLSNQSGVRFSYWVDGRALDTEVCLAGADLSLGDALLSLFPDGTVDLVVAGSRHVVLAPVRGVTPAAGVVRDGVNLERIAVTGTAAGAAERQTTHVLEVIDGDRLRRLGGGSLGEALNALVPGIWTWGGSAAAAGQQTPFGVGRGSGSSGAPYPRIYLDGIEVTNPLLLAHLSFESVERLEVIRGPQGSALYGSDAIGGVINIVTRRDPGDGS
jgi:iron complex outermembrane recepter protein